MSRLTMHNVGDGLHISIGNPYNPLDFLTIDYGGDKNLKESMLYGKFMLSHFHLDHYNGLFGTLMPHLHITDFYYPAMPIFDNNKAFYLALFSIAAFIQGVPIQHSVIEQVKRNNCPFMHPINFVPLARGQKIVIGQHAYDILWPPAKMTDPKTLKKIKTALTDFTEACKVHDKLRQLYDRFNQLSEGYLPLPGKVQNDSKFNTSYDESEESKGLQFGEQTSNLHDNPEFDPGQESDRILEKDRIIAKANKSLRNAANDLSLAFKRDDDLLFLGDLERDQLERVVKGLVGASSTKFDVIITAHHGTHWHDELFKLSATCCLASVGSLHKYLNPKYKLVGAFVNTKDYGADIICK